MPEQHNRPQWPTMSEADFDTEAPDTLAVPAGPARILAVPDACGTEALFGEEPPPERPRTARSLKRDYTDGQEQLF